VSRVVRFTAEASAELEEAVQWYEAKRVGLGLELIAVVDNAVRAMSRWPNAGARIEGLPMELPVRRVPLFRFPYYVAYLVTVDTIHVLAVAHDRRRPRYWDYRIPADPA
jgi:plasmid stabilization system protein ParE